MADVQQQFPQVNFPIADKDTGLLTAPWYQFFVTLWNKTNSTSSNVDITSGTINGTTIGNIDPAAGSFTALHATSGSIAGDVIITANAVQSLLNKTLINPVITGGTINASSIQGTPVSATPPTLNQVLIFNGANYVPAAQGSSFTFSVTSFSDGVGGAVEIGTGTWEAIGALSFTATYFGSVTGATVSMSGAGNAWSPNSLTMTGSFLGPTATTQVVAYPAVDGVISFSLAATDGSNPSGAVINHGFYNRAYYGTSTIVSGYTAGNVTGLANNPLQGGKSTTFTVNPSAGQYIIYAFPTRYGTASFTVNGFTGGFQPPETVGITNGSGYTENYYVYRSTNSGLGSTTVSVS